MTPVGSMASVRLALDALQKAASKRQFHGNKQIHDSIGHISSSLILLVSLPLTLQNPTT